jgi:hypothetical protein
MTIDLNEERQKRREKAHAAREEAKRRKEGERQSTRDDGTVTLGGAAKRVVTIDDLNSRYAILQTHGSARA